MTLPTSKPASPLARLTALFIDALLVSAGYFVAAILFSSLRTLTPQSVTLFMYLLGCYKWLCELLGRRSVGQRLVGIVVAYSRQWWRLDAFLRVLWLMFPLLAVHGWPRIGSDSTNARHCAQTVTGARARAN